MGNTVRMYNCGPTPYDEQHIGNMVPPILGDLLKRTLNTWGYKVKQVMNITDFGHLTGDNEGDPDSGDDKMTRGLKREGLSILLIDKNVRALTRIADTHHVLEKGRIVWSGTSAELAAREDVQHRYLGV